MRHRILPRALRLDSMQAWRGVLLAGILGLVVLVAWAVILHREARRQARRQAGRSAVVVAQSVARENERLLDAARQLLLALSQRPEVVGAGNRAACPALLAGIRGAVTGYLDLVAVKPDGEVFCSARGTKKLPVGLEAADIRATAESGNPVRGRFGIDRVAGRPTLALATPAIDDAGTVRAVVAASLDLGQLERVMVESPLPAGSALMLIDAGGVILSHHAQPERWRGEILDDAQRELMTTPTDGIADASWLDDVPSLVLFEPLLRDADRVRDATIAVALPRQAVYKDADRLFGLELAGLGLLTLAVLVCGALVMDQLVARPAQGLLRVIRSLNSGDVRARMRKADERHTLVGRLARSVNALGRRLEEHQQAARHLEEQLRTERTARLLATAPAMESAADAPAGEEGHRAAAHAEGAAVYSVPPADATEPGEPGDEHGWGLRESPFENAPNPRFLWLSPTHSDALVRLTYALRQRRGCAVLTGEPGCGKTLLTRAVVQRLDPERYEIGLLTNPHGGRIDLLRQVLYELGVDSGESSRTELLHTLHELVVANAQRGRETLIIVDDAQQVEDPAWFEELSSLLNIQTNERTLITLLLAGTPELTGVIQKVQHLDRRVSVRCGLSPLNAEQTAQYIRYRLTVAGAESSMFGRDATLLIHQASRGIPRAINDLCDSAMLLARLDKLPTIDAGVVRRVLSGTPTAEAATEAPPGR
ncbi:MAG TPA: AAA family ATPase [Methylomirabilota bacterium]|jgi:general secretion pathway protein A|nr:AAA family ATPase [Methylomirabilota bacterium]